MIRKTALAVATLLLFGIAATPPAAYANGTISSCPTAIPATATGTWTVTTNLTAAVTVNCITVYASRVAIDLNGHSITGPGTGTGDGIIDSGSCMPSCQQNIIIATGTIQGFNFGI
jgi:hypothetical protein